MPIRPGRPVWGLRSAHLPGYLPLSSPARVHRRPPPPANPTLQPHPTPPRPNATVALHSPPSAGQPTAARSPPARHINHSMSTTRPGPARRPSRPHPPPVPCTATPTPLTNAHRSVLWEVEAQTRPDPDYLAAHGERALGPDAYLDASMRRTAASWLVEVSAEFGLHQETLSLATALLDRFLSAVKVRRPRAGARRRSRARVAGAAWVWGAPLLATALLDRFLPAAQVGACSGAHLCCALASRTLWGGCAAAVPPRLKLRPTSPPPPPRPRTVRRAGCATHAAAAGGCGLHTRRRQARGGAGASLRCPSCLPAPAGCRPGRRPPPATRATCRGGTVDGVLPAIRRPAAARPAQETHPSVIDFTSIADNCFEVCGARGACQPGCPPPPRRARGPAARPRAAAAHGTRPGFFVWPGALAPALHPHPASPQPLSALRPAASRAPRPPPLLHC